ncbi:MAG TPA: class I SAM-dependent methyltransferase [Syntrophorhabdaceae bacterium]|nr:class I SAM-dependent methyltransferase [Syntrophorhabdaceae bacterium]
MTQQDNNAALTNDKTSLGVDSRLFWDEKASEYTLPFEEKTVARTNQVIDLLERKGIIVAGTHILDVGSGPGTFALPLALLGASVTALDISDKMLLRLIAEAQRVDVTVARTVRASWKEIDPDTEALSGAFDIVLTALSQAVEDEEDILKMEKCSRQWCVYIATGKIQRHPTCNKIRRMLSLSLNPRPDIRNIRKTLKQMGRIFSYTSFPITIEETKTMQELALDLARSVEAQGRGVDQSRILTAIATLFRDREQHESVQCKRRSVTGVLIWRGNEK